MNPNVKGNLFLHVSMHKMNHIYNIKIENCYLKRKSVGRKCEGCHSHQAVSMVLLCDSLTWNRYADLQIVTSH